MIYSQEVQTAEKKNYVPEDGSIPQRSRSGDGKW